MAENDMPERMGRIEQKVDALSVSVATLSTSVVTLSTSVTALSASVDARFEQVDKRFEDVDKRFDEVRDHFVEQREYIEFAYDRLERRIAGSELKLTEAIARVEGKLDRLIDSQSKARPRTTPSRRSRPPKRRR